MQDLEELCKQQMKNDEMTRAMTGKKPAMRLSKGMLLSIYQQQLLQSKQFGTEYTATNSIITLTYAPCTEPISTLQRIPLSELLLETVHRGKYVLFKTLAEPDKSVGIRTVVEDPEGNVDIFSLYNYALDRHHSEILPAGIILVLKEPYYKISASGGAMLRCDHPQNIVQLDADDPLVQKLTWSSGLPNSNEESKELLPFDKYRLKGNDFFKGGKFYDAVATYTRGLASTSSDANSTILRLNRAAALLKLEHNEAAIDDCRKILELNAHNEKALYRAAKAFYALGEYDQAWVKMQLYARVTVNREEAENELKSIRDRLSEKQSGTYDWNIMIAEAKRSSTPRLDHASYIGPVRVANISNERGRGLVLTHDVRKGELLLCSKAFQVCYPTEAGLVTYINMETKLTDQGAQGMLAQKTVQRLINNPSLARSFFSLYAGHHRLAKIPSILKSTPPVIDAFWVGDICSINSFGLVDCDLNPREDQSNTFRYNHLADSPGAVFLMASYINHACFGNCIRSFIGDMMIVRALDDLLAGTELLMTYVDLFWDFEERQLAIEKHGFVCNCRLCQLDRADSKELRDRRKAAFQTFQNEIFPKMKHNLHHQLGETIKETENVVKRIERTYEESNRRESQISLCIPLMSLAKMYALNGSPEKSISIYMRILKIHRFGTKESAWTASLFPTMVHMCLLYYETRQVQLGQLWLEKLRAELTITATGDDRVFTEEHRELFRRLGVKL